MFSINESLTDLKVKDRNIFKILYSMNSHPVSMPGYASEDARCYILFFSEGPNLSAFIGLYLTHVDRKFFYTYTSNTFPYEAQDDVEDEARNFAEEMGFLLDEINVSGMAVEDRNHWIEEQLIFGYKHPEPEKVEEKPAAPAAAEQPAAVPEQEIHAAVEHTAAPVPAPEPVPLQAQPPQAPAAPQTAPSQPGQPYGQPPQQPVPQGYYPAPAAPQPPSVLHAPPVLEEPPILEHPEDTVTETQQNPPAKVPSPPKAPVKKKAPAQKNAPPPVLEEQAEDEVPVEYEIEDQDQKPRSLFEEAIKQGVVKPPKPKTAKAAHSASGVVTRDKEALARLLASF